MELLTIENVSFGFPDEDVKVLRNPGNPDEGDQEDSETVVQPGQPFVLPVKPDEDDSIPVILDFKKLTDNQLPSVTADRAGVSLEIPSNTRVTSDWDKKIQAPTRVKTTPENEASIIKALVRKQLVGIAAHIKVGGSQPIEFDRHVSLIFTNLGTNEAGFTATHSK